MKNASRLKIIRFIICLGFLVGILFSHELWFPFERTFPRAPILFALPAEIIVPVERLLSTILVISLVLLAVVSRPRIFLLSAIFSLALLIVFDQMRLQPWVYQDLLMLIVFASHHWTAEDETDSIQTLFLLRLLMTGLYFWSGLQKLNFTFSQETLSFLLAPLEQLFPSVRLPLVLVGLLMALIESLLGICLLLRRTRQLSVVLAVAMHGLILTLLISQNYNKIIWIWNAVLIFTVVALFWQSDLSVKQMIAQLKECDWRKKLAPALVLISVLLPALSFFGLWDMYLSGALFSGNTATAVIRINDETFAKLPLSARQQVFQIKNGGIKVLPLFEWAMSELNAPVYPEQRVFKQAARAVCQLTADNTHLELIVKERPAIVDGSSQITRIECAQIER